MPRGLALLLALGILAPCLVTVRARLEPPTPLARDADEHGFSAARALDRLHALIGDDRPHPVGSPAGEAVQRHILAEFTALGIEAEIQSTFACSVRSASCGRVGNVVARLPGRASGPALLVSAHHDSVPAGPGAGDDGSGVSAILELARALTREPPHHSPVVLLLVDGEEAGLLGAEAFVAQHPWAREVGAAINLDAGGTRGVTSITRTSPGNTLLVDAFAADVPRPYGASVTGTVYGLTPYDTDWSVYNRNGILSIDLGFGEDKAHYHTPLDQLSNLDPASVQHLGDTALALVRRLADQPLPAPPPADFAEQHKSRPRPWLGERVFLDALGWALVTWPALATPLLALLAVALLSLATWRMRPVLQDSLNILIGTPDAHASSRHALDLATDAHASSRLAHAPDLATDAHASPRLDHAHSPGPHAAPVARETRRRRVLLALAFPLLVLVPAALGGGLAWLLATFTSSEFPGHVDPFYPRLAVWSAVLAASGLLAARLLAVLGPARLALAIWWSLAGITLASSIAAPAASVGFLPPVLLAAVLLTLLGRRLELALLFALPLPGLLWLQAAVRLEAMFGLGIAGAAVIALISALVAPLWPAPDAARRSATRLPLALLPLTLLAAGLTFTVPAYSDERPRRLTLVLHHDADTGNARWLVDGDLPLPRALAPSFDPEPAPAFPWTPDDEPSWTAPADPLPAPPPDLSLEPGAPDLRGPWGRYLKLRLRSPRGARTAALVIPDSADVRWLAIGGEDVPLYPEHRRKWYRDVRHHPIVGIPPEGLVIELAVRSHDPVTFTVIDSAEGLPPTAAALLTARPTWTTPSHGGDRTIVSRSFNY
ncbi:MAG: M28 family peptidase [Myxococcales bacterium]|nr:M28 family peptidase [Myxococcales bacterium]